MMARSLALGLVSLLVSGCGGPASYDDFRDQLAGRYCDYMVRCGRLGASETTQCPPAPALGAASATGLDIDAALDGNRVAFHGGRAQKCLDTLKSLPCDGKQSAADLTRYCHAIIEPKLGPGQVCRDDLECLGGACTQTTLGCGGTCVAFAATGAACVQTGSDPSQRCDPTVHFCDPTTSTCQLLREAGGTCSNDTQCAFDLACVSGNCAPPPRLKAGQACGGLLTLPPCADGLGCTASGVCAPPLVAGADCSDSGNCQDGLVCVADVCSAWSDLGRACVINPDATASNCPVGQSCTNAVCVASAAASTGVGHSCATVACYGGLWCNNGSCSYQAGLGGSCMSDTECASGLTCDTASSKTCREPAC